MKKLVDIMIVDDHDIFRDGIVMLLKHKKLANIVGEASNGTELIQKLPELKPEVVIMDISMPEMDGIQATKEALQLLPELKIIILTMIDDRDKIIQLIDLGIKGFLSKSAGKDELIQAIEKVCNGQTYFSSEIINQIARQFSIPTQHQNSKSNTPPCFSTKEMDIIHYLCEGLSTKDISDKLFLSPKTIEGYKSKIFEKAGVKNAIQLVVFAIKSQLIQL